MMIGLVVVYIEFGRRQAIAVPIPFLLLLGGVVLVAALFGKRAGVAGAVVASLYIFYSMTIGFGPASLTGGPFEATLGTILMVAVGYLLGRTKDQNTSLFAALEQSQLALEERVEARTAELSLANEHLRREISDRREIENQAQRQHSLAVVGQLAAGIAHDFNNIMSVILLYAQLLERSQNLSDKEKKRVRTIIDEGLRAAGLTAQILDFSRQTVLERKRVDLVPILQEFVKLLELTLPDNITIELTHERNQYFLNADANRLQQVLMNLALNSRDAMPDGGHLQIDLSDIEHNPEEPGLLDGPASDGWVKIKVIDSGTGISSEGMNHLFEPFFTTKEPGKGTGLGLPQVYGIVKQHDGFVDIDTEVGVGTSFGIVLPKAASKWPDETLVSSKELIKGNQEMLLIVEDNDTTRMAMMGALESLNYRVIGVRNGVEALVVLKRRPEVDLVISDVMMPEMGGVALLDAMEAEGIVAPIFLLTGNSATEELELVKAAGRAEIYSKPISLETMTRIIVGYLNPGMN